MCACLCVVMMEETSRDKLENWLRTSCVDGFVWRESVCVYVCVRERKRMHVCMIASRNKQENQLKRTSWFCVV